MTRQSEERQLPKSVEAYNHIIRSKVQQPANPKFLCVAVIGMPNAGKSTLANQLIGMKVSAVSKKVHTTRRNILGTLVHDSTQILFSDSPGLVEKRHCVKHRLEHTFLTQPVQSVDRADVVMVVVDASNPRERKSLSPGVIEKLSRVSKKPAILVLNKVDMIRQKRKLFDYSYQLTDGKIMGRSVDGSAPRTVVPHKRPSITRQLDAVEKRAREKGYIHELPQIQKVFDAPDIPEEEEQLPTFWTDFTRVFMVSALENDGVDDLREYLLSIAKPGDWQFSADVITNQSPETMLVTTIREKMLETLSHEVPYVTVLKIASWCINRTGTLCVSVDLLVPKRRYVSQVLGEAGKLIETIANDSRQELSNMFKCDVSLKLVVKCTERPK